LIVENSIKLLLYLNRLSDLWGPLYFPEMEKHTKKSKNNEAEVFGYNYFNDRVEQLMKELNEKYLNHVNLYAGLAYKDDPAIMGLLITNENDLTNHFGNLMLPNKNNPYHEQRKISLCLPDVAELNWDKESSPDKNTTIISDIDHDFIPQNQYAVTSDTKQLKRNWRDGIQTINTSHTQAAQGWIGNQVIRLNDANIIVRTPKKAAIAISSLDGKPIRQSNKLLITLVARAIPLSGRKLPFLSEPIKSQIQIKNITSGLKLVPLNAQGEKLESIKPTWLNHNFPQKEGTHWFLLAS